MYKIHRSSCILFIKFEYHIEYLSDYLLILKNNLFNTLTSQHLFMLQLEHFVTYKKCMTSTKSVIRVS